MIREAVMLAEARQYLLKVIFSPGTQSLKINASKLIVNVGGRTEIICSVNGWPVLPNITWFKEGKVIRQSSHTKVETFGYRSLLTLRDVKSKDDGEYHCQARYIVIIN